MKIQGMAVCHKLMGESYQRLGKIREHRLLGFAPRSNEICKTASAYVQRFSCTLVHPLGDLSGFLDDLSRTGKSN